jgi:hypothetical protein
MAGSGIGGAIGGGWISGTPSWYDRHRVRRDKFLADHPEWSLIYIASRDVYEASMGDNDNGLDILMDRSLGQLMDRLEARYPASEETEEGEAQHV